MWLHLEFVICQQQRTALLVAFPFSYKQQLKANSAQVPMHLLVIVTLESRAQELHYFAGRPAGEKKKKKGSVIYRENPKGRKKKKLGT